MVKKSAVKLRIIEKLLAGSVQTTALGGRKRAGEARQATAQ
jgi:hypothetical protein